MYDYSELIKKITKQFGGVEELAKFLKKDVRTLADKLASIKDFKQSEIEQLCEVLCIDKKDIGLFFFVNSGL